MKRLKAIIIILVITAAVLTLSIMNFNESTSDDISNIIYIGGVGIGKINDNSFLEKLNATRYNIILTKEKIEDDYSNIDDITDRYIETDKYIIKYSSDDSGNIAYHMNELSADTNGPALFVREINDSSYGVTDDCFVIYNTRTNQKKIFKAQDEFTDYCRENDLNLFEWKYSNGMTYETVKLSDKCSLIMSKSVSLTDQFVYDGKVIFEGYISKYKFENGTATFSIKVQKKDILEFPTSSDSGLTFPGKTVGKQFIGFGFVFPMYEDIYYDGKIAFDEADGTFREIS